MQSTNIKSQVFVKVLLLAVKEKKILLFYKLETMFFQHSHYLTVQTVKSNKPYKVNSTFYKNYFITSSARTQQSPFVTDDTSSVHGLSDTATYRAKTVL